MGDILRDSSFVYHILEQTLTTPLGAVAPCILQKNNPLDIRVSKLIGFQRYGMRCCHRLAKTSV